MNSVRYKNLSLKYQRFTPSGGKNIGIRKSEFVTKTQFLSHKISILREPPFPRRMLSLVCLVEGF